MALEDNGFRCLLNQCWGTKSVYLYHNRDDFRRLWCFGHDVLGTKENPADAVLIFWSGYPEPSVQKSRDQMARTNNYVSPYHWALALATHCIRDQWTTMPRVIVVHAIPSSNAADLDRFGKLCRSVAIALPWLSGMSLFSDLGEGSDLQPFDRAPDLGAAAVSAAGVVPLLQTALRQQIVDDPDDRHTIANIIGPSLLAAGCGVSDPTDSEGAEPRQKAIVALLRQMGWLPESALVENSFPKQLKTRLDKLHQIDPLSGMRMKEGLRYYLLDDQANAGFGDVLRLLLDLRLPDALTCSEDPKQLLEWLTPGKKGLTAFHLDKIDVLFLDLRLWLGNASDAKPVLGEITNIATQWQSAITDPHFRDALAAAKRAVDDRLIDEHVELAALALFPLLIAHADPSLPVIIFSSTRQRDVMRLLQHMPNIRCQFTKPFLPGGAGTAARDALQNNALQLVAAIQAALGDLRFRPVWRRIASLARIEPPKYFGLEPDKRGNKEGRGLKVGNDRWINAEYHPSLESTQLRLRHSFARLSRGDIDSFLSACFELIENGYSTTDEKQQYQTIELFLEHNSRLPKGDATAFHEYRFTLLAMALRAVRNHKAHALHRHADPAWNEGDAIKFAGAAMLLALLDFLGRSEEVEFHISTPPKKSMIKVAAPWDIGRRASRDTDAVFVMSVLVSCLRASVDGVRKDLELPPAMPAKFFSAELMELCNAMIRDESRYLSDASSLISEQTAPVMH